LITKKQRGLQHRKRTSKMVYQMMKAELQFLPTERYALTNVRMIKFAKDEGEI